MLLEDRLAQIVPTLNPAQVQFALRFARGLAKHFAPDEKLLDVGDRNMAVWLVIEGSIVASRRDGLGRERRRGFAALPSRDTGPRRVDDVGDVGAFEAPALLEVVKNSGYCALHECSRCTLIVPVA